MKRVMALLLACVLASALAGCAKDGGVTPDTGVFGRTEGVKTAAPAGVSPAESPPVDTPEPPEPTAVADGAWESAYDVVLAAYEAAVESGFAQYDEKLISEALAMEAVYDSRIAANVFYAYHDIDDNGTPELVLGADGGGITIYDLYGFDGAKAVRLIDNSSLGYRAWAYINEDGIIPLWGGEGAGVGSWSYFRIAADGYTLTLVEQIGMERGANWDNDPDSLDYYHRVGEGASEPITEAKYLEIGGKYQNGSFAALDWKPFAVTSADDPAAIFAAYAAIVEAGEKSMTLPADLTTQEYPDMAAALDIGSGKLEVRDITGDDVPELICLTQRHGYEEWLNVWTWRGGKTEKVFEQRVRSLAGGGGNYSAFITKGELYVYASENGSNFDYGFWNVSAYIIKTANVGYESEPYAFIGNRETALMFCRIVEGDTGGAEYMVNGKAATAVQAADWLSDLASGISTVLMDSADSKMPSYDGGTIDVGLYAENLGPWSKYVTPPYKSVCVTWDVALTALRGERELRGKFFKGKSKCF